MPSPETPHSSHVSFGHKSWRASLWCLGLGLFANAAAIVYTHAAAPRSFPDITLDSKAFAQAAENPPDRMLGARGIYMMPAQLGTDIYGLYLLDVDSGTICVYRAVPGNSRFHLMAVRSFKYDRFLDDLNNDSPTPEEVQHQVEAQRQRTQLEKKDEPKP